MLNRVGSFTRYQLMFKMNVGVYLSQSVQHSWNHPYSLILTAIFHVRGNEPENFASFSDKLPRHLRKLHWLFSKYLFFKCIISVDKNVCVVFWKHSSIINILVRDSNLWIFELLLSFQLKDLFLNFYIDLIKIKSINNEFLIYNNLNLKIHES